MEERIRYQVQLVRVDFVSGARRLCRNAKDKSDGHQIFESLEKV